MTIWPILQSQPTGLYDVSKALVLNSADGNDTCLHFPKCQGMALKHVEEEINMAMQRRLGSADRNLRLVLDLVGTRRSKQGVYFANIPGVRFHDVSIVVASQTHSSGRFFFSHFYFPASGQAVVTGVVPSSPRFLSSIFIARRVQQSHCPSIFHRVLLTHALALSASQLCTRKSPKEFIRACTRRGSNSRN